MPKTTVSISALSLSWLIASRQPCVVNALVLGVLVVVVAAPPSALPSL